jgi:phosphatidate phosphatase LPIN
VELFTQKVPQRTQAALEKVAEAVSKLGGQIRTHIQDNGDIMLDAQGYKSSDEETKQLDNLARRIFAEETSGEGSLDTLLGHDQNGNLWIYASEEAKLFAESQSGTATPVEIKRERRPTLKSVARVIGDNEEGTISRAESEPAIPTMNNSKSDEGYSYAKTLRLTSEQLVFPIISH